MLLSIRSLRTRHVPSAASCTDGAASHQLICAKNPQIWEKSETWPFLSDFQHLKWLKHWWGLRFGGAELDFS